MHPGGPDDVLFRDARNPQWESVCKVLYDPQSQVGARVPDGPTGRVCRIASCHMPLIIQLDRLHNRSAFTRSISEILFLGLRGQAGIATLRVRYGQARGVGYSANRSPACSLGGIPHTLPTLRPCERCSSTHRELCPKPGAMGPACLHVRGPGFKMHQLIRSYFFFPRDTVRLLPFRASVCFWWARAYRVAEH